MEGMAEYPNKFFDLAIVDPPYGKDIARKGNQGKNGGTDRRWVTDKTEIYKPKRWDVEKPTTEYFQELFRISKNQIIWGGNYFWEHLKQTEAIIVWDKESSGNYADGEMAWTSFDANLKIFRWLWNGFRKEKPEERIHPTQKPVALYLWLLENYAKPGDKILDTHVGSASSLIAFEAGGFEYVGFEIDKDYYEAAKKRLETWRSLPLFDEKKVIEQLNLDL